MKILYIITKADEIGGAQIHVRDLARRLHNDGNKVTVIVGEDGALVRQLKELHISVRIVENLVRQISPLNDIKAIFNIRKIIKDNSPDIIGLHSSKAGIVGRLAACRLNIPVVFTAHGWAFAEGISDKKRKLFIFIEKILSPFLDKIITVSEQDKKLALDLGVASSEKQVVIHNGMPDITIKRKDYSDSTKVRLISVARFSEQKDHETLFHALKLISTDNWTLTLVGKGPKLENIKKLASDLNIANNILFLGERDDVDNLLSESDVFCLITNWEGLPLSIIEAMRASLPVVATDVGGVSELVEHKKTGLLHSPKNIQELANILDTIINDSDLRYKLGNAGRVKYQNNFTFEHMYYATIDEYNKLIHTKLLIIFFLCSLFSNSFNFFNFKR